MTYYLLTWPPIEVLPNGTRRQLTEEEALGQVPEKPQGGYFQFNWPVGRDSRNERDDVLRAQTLLGHAGYFDMERTEGPTGWYGKPLEIGIREFQRDNGLTVDGYMEPGGETLTALEQQFGQDFASHRPPSLKIVDDHHERRTRGEPGLLQTDRGKGVPFGAPLETSITKELKPLPPGMQPAETAPRGRLGNDSAEGEVHLATAAPGTLNRRDPIIRSWPEGGPIVMGGGGGRGGAGAAKNVGRALDGVSQPNTSANPAVQAQAVKDFVSQNRISLELGISEGFGVVERHESENTRQSGIVLRDECLKALAARGLNGFQHIAGGMEEDNVREKSERAVKDGKLGEGGGGHSFPDLIFSDGKVYIAFNTATKSGGKFTPREINSFETLAKNLGQWVAEIIDKKPKDESWEDYQKRAEAVCHKGIDRMLEKEREKLQQQEDQQQPQPSDASPSP